jgi:hypothetical protein
MQNPNRKMKLMSDYQCWCLWDMIDPKNVNPDTLEISEALRERLHSWDPTRIGFEDEQEYNAFYEMGWELFDSLRSELPDIEWWYRDRRYADLLNAKPSNV